LSAWESRADAATENDAPAGGRGLLVDAAGGARVRIAYGIDSMEVGGSELNAVRTAERLDRDRFELVAVTLRQQGPLSARYDAAGIPIREFRLRHGTAGFPSLVWRLASFFRRERIDVVHAHDKYTNVFLTLAARLARHPAVITSKRWSRWNPPQWGPRNRFAYRLADRVLANSRAVADSVEREDGVRPDRVVVVPNFIDDAAFEPIGTSERRRRLAEFGITADAPVIGVVAGLKPVKDHATLLRAAALLGAEWPSLQVLLVGDGPSRGALEAMVRELGLGERVRFAGMQPNVPNPHRLLDVSVLCSTHEGFPNAIVEAMAAARPVVATRVGGVPDAVADGVTGLLLPPSDPERLAGALGTLLADSARRDRFGEAAQRHARTHYHESVVIPPLEALYERLARRGAAVAARP